MGERTVLSTHDGGRLALFSYGTVDAPGERRVLLIGGAFLTALIYRPFSIALAKGLGEGWAVNVYDRRGRGRSDGSIDTAWLDGFEAAVNNGRVGHALAHMKKATSPGSALARIPEPVLAGLMALLSRTKVNKMFREVMPSGVGELRGAYKESDHARDFSVLPANTHFMAGGKSHSYYKVTAERLHAAVPGSTHELSPKGFHGSIPAAAVNELVTDISDYFKGEQ